MNLSIKNVPEDVVERLRKRAERHHRSLQGELLAIIEAAAPPRRPLTGEELQKLLAEIRKLNLPSVDESTALIRTHRDAGFD